MLTRAVFLDKDGTLVENVPYNVDPDRVRLVNGSLEGLRAICQAGYRVIVITNQSGVARGLFTEEALGPVQERLQLLLKAGSIPLAGFYYCPHHPDGLVRRYATRCFCRKPNPGLLFRAAREHKINLAASWMIGDILNDVEAGRRAGCRTILIDNGHETEWDMSPIRKPHFTAKSFLEATELILSTDLLNAGVKRIPHISPPATQVGLSN